MASRTVLPLAALSLCVALVSLSPTPATADTRVGRLGILCDVHGYRVGDYVVVPLRGIAEWLGAEVTYKNPTIELKRGKHLTKTTLNKKTATVDGRQITLPTAPKVYDGITCVPLRLISAAFPVDVEYKAGDAGLPARVPSVSIRFDGRLGRVVVHATSPAVTAQIIAAEEASQRAEGSRHARYAVDWWFACHTVLKHGYVWSDNAHEYLVGSGEFSPESDGGLIWSKKGGAWRCVSSLGCHDDEWDDQLRQLGVPNDVLAEVAAGIGL